MALQLDTGGRPLEKIHIGGICASRNPTVVRTILGSCIAVCLRDPINRVGGMNHFMLPDCATGGLDSACYGVHSMELLINACMRQGAQRNALEAKVFGGGHVLKMRETDNNVPQSNIRFTIDFLMTEGIPVIAKDVGGYAARELYFFTDTFKTLMKRMAETGLNNEDMQELESEQAQFARQKAVPDPKDDDITLF